jgi:hypothetical protein
MKSESPPHASDDDEAANDEADDEAVADEAVDTSKITKLWIQAR